MLLRGARLLGPALAIFLLARAAPGQTPALSLRVGLPEQGWPALIELGPVLEDPALREALQSALPLRLHLRVDLWRRGFVDRLVDFQEFSVAVLQDPLDQGYVVETATNRWRVTSLGAAHEVLADVLRPDLRPSRAGRHYYMATLEVETLSLSDLDELRRWLRGEVEPAIGGRSPPMRAVERGLRRVLIRVIGLPTRRFEARTGTFDSS